MSASVAPHSTCRQLVARYAQAVAPLAQRQVGRIATSITRAPAALLENPLGNLIADVQLAATHPREKGGAQLRALLEQQFASGSNSVASPRVLMPSQGFSYAYDLAGPAGGRVSHLRLEDKPIVDTARYRVTTNNFLAAGGDNFTVFTQGTDALGGDLDIDALAALLSANTPARLPATDRIRRIAP